ncbi:MAG: SIS domain-containing protein [candidate division Zixibacteria bacterium]|nr:SIS domain-containing protein [candidate division Zixibacteria bacterium]
MLSSHVGQIEKAAGVLTKALEGGHKIFFCGNGGSAADAQHLAAELVVRLRKNSKVRPLPALALTTNSSVLTACSNDLGFDYIFSRQIEALGQKGDVLFAISTSGKSKNVILACQTARKRGLKVVSLLGQDGGGQARYTDCKINIPSGDTPRIQEAHITLGHIICDLIVRKFSGNK